VLLIIMIAAIFAGIGGGFAVYHLNPRAGQLVAHWWPGKTPTANATGTPAAGRGHGDTRDGSPTMFQQFNAAITSYQAQPVDAHTGLQLIIPKLHVSAPIVERGLVQGWMVVAPGQAVTHFIYSAYPGAVGNSVLYSHAGTVFRHLDSLAVGDTIVVQTPRGATQFRVREMRIVAPTDVSVLDASQTATLTLLTCYPFGVDSSRLVIIADLVGP